MGHKVHPIGFRLGVIRDWQCKWYAKKNFAEFLGEDVRLREAIHAKYREAGISLIEIERQVKDVTITLHTARPGIVIGRGGQRVDEMRVYLERLIGKRIRLNIMETRQPELDAYLVARAIADQIEHRVAYRRAMKQAIFRTMQAGAKGIKVSCAGRLGNSEIARRQTMHQGQVPLHTLRADIDYGFTEARTTLGRIGVKAWVYKGEILPLFKERGIEEAPAAGAPAEAEPTATAETAEVAVEAVAEETAEAAVAAIPEALPAAAEEKTAEPAIEVTAEAAPTEAVEEKPKPKAKKAKAKTAAEEKAVAPAAEVTAEAAPTEAVEEKPKPKAKKAKASTVAEEKAVEPAAEATAEAAPAKVTEEKPKPKAKTAKAKPATKATDITEEAKDATT